MRTEGCRNENLNSNYDQQLPALYYLFFFASAFLGCEPC